ncbi:MAG: methionyl-tRNA formyltransferase [Alphaproteobacteria bacterium]|nr:methionyl-tRNA formyltransferase [Alphaproteobacteria bacterium SS10]
MRIAFMGTPDFSVTALRALINAKHDVACVYSQPPRKSGRGHKEQPSPVHAAALGAGIEVRTPVSLRNEEAQAEFAALNLDAAVVVAYGLILPKEILEAPKHGCFNIHASLLPRWRGAAPIQRAIEAGDTETGITIMQMDEGLDTGAMLMVEATPITLDDDAGTLHDRLSAMGAKMMVEGLELLNANRLIHTPQPDDGVTYAAKLEKAESEIDWSLPAKEIERRIRAFRPWPGSKATIGEKGVKVLAASLADGKAGAEPGTILDKAPVVACADGTALQLDQLQRPGKAAVDGAAFWNGMKTLTVGDRLS